MRNLILLTSLLIFIAACSGTRHSPVSDPINPSPGNTRTIEVAFIDENAYLLTETHPDKAYGITPSNPINVGGVAEMSGPLNQRRFLNGLAGPNGEEVQYHRAGSCCGFKTSNGFNNKGMLDRYKVYWHGGRDTVTLFLNMYDKGNLMIPAGFKARS